MKNQKASLHFTSLAFFTLQAPTFAVKKYRTFDVINPVLQMK